MERFTILIISIAVCIVQCQEEDDTVLSAVLTPGQNLIRQERSYYERYGSARPYDRLDDRPSRCGRCDDDDDDYDRGRDRDDDRRSNRPTQNNRYDRNNNDDDDRRYDNDRNNSNKNGTDDENDDKKRPHDDRNRDKHYGGRRDKHRNRYDDRDRYSPDYYDRFLRDPYRDRDRYYEEPYPRRPSYGRYPPYPYDRYDDYGGGYDRYGSGYRSPYYEERYNRGGGYDDAYGGYGPGVGRGPHESFRPWDETYRGQAGWDAGGRGYYFASGRPDAGSWGQREYSRPITSGGGWQNSGYSGYSNGNGYSSGYPAYRGSGGYSDGYQDLNGYGQSSGWRSVGERRPYRDQSGVANLDKRRAPQDSRYGQNQPGYSQAYQPGTYTQSSTTPGTSYLFQREDEIVTQADTTVPPS
ncbi:aspartate and glycine-rich protein [Melitaea cinxia]|uniref:aspartate and glycine-rich protein n=1 Tax=Melitaea cinxia TaxID=113334 RepID=UPI001E26E996|nr:aspartate and glycine-rich protein [Melitaea cinxia]